MEEQVHTGFLPRSVCITLCLFILCGIGFGTEQVNAATDSVIHESDLVAVAPVLPPASAENSALTDINTPAEALNNTPAEALSNTPAEALNSTSAEALNSTSAEALNSTSAEALAPTKVKVAQRRQAGISGDVIRMQETVVSGNQELPKVLYLVPWQQPTGFPEITLEPELSELQVFRRLYPPAYRRELKYYQLLQTASTEK
ncbi:MAG: hypothetical protein KUG75_11520 [Pseudomonadales bacterium]|nr:hypothetical protein [Pseudomonadales bacterium]